MRKLLIVAALFAMPSLAMAETIHAKVKGMVCAFCAQGIEAKLRENASVENVKVDLEGGLVTIGTKPSQTLSDSSITKIITAAGYTVDTIHHQE